MEETKIGDEEKERKVHENLFHQHLLSGLRRRDEAPVARVRCVAIRAPLTRHHSLTVAPCFSLHNSYLPATNLGKYAPRTVRT